MDTGDLMDMMFGGRPIEEFEKLLKSGDPKLDWGELLHMCYMEQSYERVGGDLGYEENPPINHERLAYLAALIDFLKRNGIKGNK
jgi:hypothetical protein